MHREEYEAPRVEQFCLEPMRRLLVEVSPAGTSGENAGDEDKPGF